MHSERSFSFDGMPKKQQYNMQIVCFLLEVATNIPPLPTVIDPYIGVFIDISKLILGFISRGIYCIFIIFSECMRYNVYNFTDLMKNAIQVPV